MVVHHKKEDNREHNRVADPAIRLKIGAKIYQSINWSLGGILINGYEGGLSTGALVSITQLGLSRGVMTTVKVSGRVIRADDEAAILAIQMLEIDQPTYAILQRLLVKKMQLMRARPRAG